MRDALRGLRRKALRTSRTGPSDNRNTAFLISIGLQDAEPHEKDADDDGIRPRMDDEDDDRDARRRR